MEVLILKDLVVNIMMVSRIESRAKSLELGWFAEILVLKAKRGSRGCLFLKQIKI